MGRMLPELDTPSFRQRRASGDVGMAVYVCVCVWTGWRWSKDGSGVCLGPAVADSDLEGEGVLAPVLQRPPRQTRARVRARARPRRFTHARTSRARARAQATRLTRARRATRRQALSARAVAQAGSYAQTDPNAITPTMCIPREGGCLGQSHDTLWRPSRSQSLPSPTPLPPPPFLPALLPAALPSVPSAARPRLQLPHRVQPP